MDHVSFDRIARLLGGASSRRSGLRAALAGIAGLTGLAAGAPDALGKHGSKDRSRDKREGKDADKTPKPEGPCGDRSRKDNLCTKNSQCCTKYCKKSLKNKDGKGRCRCIKKGKPCKPQQTCCGALTCTEGFCQRLSSGGIPTGQACVQGVDACADSNASCIRYYQADPAGTYCLLPGGKACKAATDCGSKDCASGVCAAEVCTVCASGCPYTTIQAAAAGVASGGTIWIAGATYSEDVVVPAKNLTLTNCNGGEVTVKNVADDARTFVLGAVADTAPHPTITIRNLTITYKGTPIAGDPAPTTPATGGGGIEAYTNLILEGYARITGCNWITDEGGGVAVWPQDSLLTLTIRGETEISNNYNQNYGGGVYLDSYTSAEVIIEGNAKITGNYCGGEGGGVYIAYETMAKLRGDAEVSYNRSRSSGGGMYLYGSSPTTTFIMSDNAKVIFNSSEIDDGGGLFLYDKVDGSYMAEFHDNALVADNVANVANSQVGGGIGAETSNNRMKVLLDGNALITRNTAFSSGGAQYVELDIQGNASIIDNTPDNCATTTLAAGSKACGV